MATNYEQTLLKLGEHIEKLRKERDMTQEGLADKVGISHAYYWSIIRNKRNLSIKTAISIANALGIPLKDLFDF